MSRLIPERPLYKRERIRVGFCVFALFALLFLVRLLSDLLPLPSNELWFKAACELGVFLLPILLFFILRRHTQLQRLRFFAPRPGQIPFLVGALLVLFSGSMLLSMLCGGTTSLGNSATSFESINESAPSLLWSIPVFALLPAVLEEIFFRGIVLSEYERRGSVRAVLMSALLFALCHFDLRNLPVYFFSGVLFALVLLATNSLFACMLLHILYNTVSLFGQRYLNALYTFTGNLELFIFLLILLLLLGLLLLCYCAARLYSSRAERDLPDPRRAIPYNIQLYTTLDALCDPPVVLCLLLSVVGFILL